MPPVLNTATQNLPQEFSKDLGYTYPRGLDLRPTSDTHKKLVDEILKRAREAHDFASPAHERWREVDRVLRVYTRPEWGSSKKNHYVRGGGDDDESAHKIVMPVSYINMETLLTYMTSAFLRAPIFRYAGIGPEDRVGAYLMQLIVQQHVLNNSIGLGLHTMWRDSFAYGRGAVHATWRQKYGYVDKVTPKSFFSQLLGFAVQTGVTRSKSYELIYEGNDLRNIDPYRYLPDPSVPIDRPQDAEYQMWVEEDTYHGLMGREKDTEDVLFNCRYLKYTSGKTSIQYSDPSDIRRVMSTKKQGLDKAGNVDVIWCYVDLIPKDWDLGSEEYPEKWMFALAADRVIIAADRLDRNDGDYPVAVSAPGYDGYSTNTPGIIEQLADIQGVTDFLYNSHVENIRKVINDMIVVDPSIVNIFDLQDNKPGKIIRIKRSMFGKGKIRDAIDQLTVQDVTQNNIAETGYLSDFAQQTTGATDAVRGVMPSRGPRISATMAGDARSSALSRLEKYAHIMNMQAMSPLGRMFASNAQQYMEQDTFIRATGDLLAALRREAPQRLEEDRILVSPEDILVRYNLEVSTGTVPGSESPELWLQLFQLALQSQNPILMQNLDWIKVFKHIARQLGARNIDEFMVQRQDNDSVLRDIQAGNLVPLPAGGDGAPATP